MQLFGGVIPITGVSFFLLCLFGVLFVGFALGRITIKGVSLGDAGVFLIALLFGALFCAGRAEGAELFPMEWLDVVESFGLVLFVTGVGFIAGPKFFANMKKNFKSYVLLGLVIIISGGLAATGCILLGKHVFGYGAQTIQDQDGFVAMIVGLLSGALTSTPAFSSAKASVAAEYQSLVSVGYGIAYIFGVIGVVLFVQLMPRLTKANMEEERAKIMLEQKQNETRKERKLLYGCHLPNWYRCSCDRWKGRSLVRQ